VPSVPEHHIMKEHAWGWGANSPVPYGKNRGRHSIPSQSHFPHLSLGVFYDSIIKLATHLLPRQRIHGFSHTHATIRIHGSSYTHTTIRIHGFSHTHATIRIHDLKLERFFPGIWQVQEVAQNVYACPSREQNLVPGNFQGFSGG
jgi:hypothetical protein